jgi:hypothetical protein
MAWRLYDTVNGEWYNDDLYDTRDECTAAADFYMREAAAMEGTLELLAEPFDPSELPAELPEEGEEM